MKKTQYVIYICFLGIALATYFLRVQIIVLKRGKRSYTESHPFLLEEFTELFLSTGLEKSQEEHHDKRKEIQIIYRLFLAIAMYCWAPSMNH